MKQQTRRTLKMNKQSSIGVLEELWTNLMNQLAIEYHLKILRDKYISQLENDLLETPQEQERASELLNYIQYDALIKVTETRREAQRKMLQIAEDSKQPVNNDLWCIVKHSAIAEITAFEALQATNFEDLALLEIYSKTKKSTNEFVSLWLGGDIISCAACLADRMKEMEEGNGNNS